MELLYLAENGVPTAAWGAACSSFGRFCHKVTASTAITFAVVVCYIMLSLISSYKLFSKYDAPAALVDNPNKGIDIANFSGQLTPKLCACCDVYINYVMVDN